MKIQQIAMVLVKAKRYVPEAARVQLCYMFTYMIGDYIRENLSIAELENWKLVGASAFLRLCEVKGPPAAVPADMRIRESLLSEFCNKWMNVSQFREPGTEDWQPITPDMNSLRVTMVNELEGLAEQS